MALLLFRAMVENDMMLRIAWVLLAAAMVTVPFVLSRAFLVSLEDGQITIRKGWTTRRLRAADLEAVEVDRIQKRGQSYVVLFRQRNAPEAKFALTAISADERRRLMEAIRQSVDSGVLRDSEALREALR
ncbi:hypothetical protein [Streptomyces sp. NBC_01217]|uniref:hypothetical protein n=1 Tax=Streptomyces sp. NBC_01217 TaxID=2903779 RepID=UPI002E122046|nr:hypothetical protein OG507_32840 [Streptomyces sp. NBC_01217]